MVNRATMESKTEGTTWKSIKNYIRNWCQKWCCIFLGAIYRENKQWQGFRSIGWTITILPGLQQRLPLQASRSRISGAAEPRPALAIFCTIDFAYMVITVACFAFETRVLSVLVAGLTLEALWLDDLTRGLVLKLVILAEVAVAKGALENTTSVVPNFPAINQIRRCNGKQYNTWGLGKGRCWQSIKLLFTNLMWESLDIKAILGFQ